MNHNVFGTEVGNVEMAIHVEKRTRNGLTRDSSKYLINLFDFRVDVNFCIRNTGIISPESSRKRASLDLASHNRRVSLLVKELFG